MYCGRGLEAYLIVNLRKLTAFPSVPAPFFTGRDAHAITLVQPPGASDTVEFIAVVRKVLMGSMGSGLAIMHFLDRRI